MCCLVRYTHHTWAIFSGLTPFSPIPGALEKIANLRQRHERLAASISHYEKAVEEQAEQLSRMNRPRNFDAGEDDGIAQSQQPAEVPMTAEDMRREEEEVKELEAKKQMLEERVNAMEQDIKGVQR